MKNSNITVRLINLTDYEDWLSLWNSYNATYGRSGETVIRDSVTTVIWDRFFNPLEPVYAHIAEIEQEVVGFVHFLYHRSTTQIENVCYIQDYFTKLPSSCRDETVIALISSVEQQSQVAGVPIVYVQVQDSHRKDRSLYNQAGRHHQNVVYIDNV